MQNENISLYFSEGGSDKEYHTDLVETEGDVSYWQAKELGGMLRKIKQGKDVNLFEEFRLFC